MLKSASDILEQLQELEESQTPSKKYNLPIIGTLETIELKYKLEDESGKSSDHILKSQKFDVIADKGDYYIVNTWYKPNVPQVILKTMVKTFIQK